MNVSSCRAMPIPITTPPRIWLRAVRGLMIRPAATALTTRVTRTWSSSSSTRTSTNTALWVLRAFFAIEIMSDRPGLAVSSTSITFSPPARIASVRLTRLVESFFRTISPSMKSRSSIVSAPHSGRPSTLSAALNSFSATLRQASCTAAPVDAAAHEPPSTGAAGRSLSPSRAVMRSGDRPSVSAATCVITV